jgi:hypothetical protein
MFIFLQKKGVCRLGVHLPGVAASFVAAAAAWQEQWQGQSGGGSVSAAGVAAAAQLRQPVML